MKVLLSVNRLEKDNAMKIAQNKKVNDPLMEIRKHVVKSICETPTGNG